MWRLIREGVRSYRPVLLISWAFGFSIFGTVMGMVALVGTAKDRIDLGKAGVQLPIAILIASMVAGFIVLGTEKSENRLRLQFTLPIPIGQIALARVLLPTALLVIGLAAAHVTFAVLLTLEGSPESWLRHVTLDFMAVQLLFWLQVALAIREILDLRHRTRWTAALGPKALLIGAIALMALILLGPWESIPGRAAGAAALVLLVMGLTVALFRRRTQFTR